MITVVPREVAPGRLYGAAAIALALVLFGVHRLPAEKVLQRLKPACARGHDRRRWRVLDRWLSAIRGRRLFPRLRVAPSAETSSARSAAAFFARQLGAFSRQLGGPIEETAVDGAMMALVA